MALCRVQNVTLLQNFIGTAKPSTLLTRAAFLQVRHRNRRDLPQKIRKNPFVSRHTDFIKHLCIALVKHERVFTTLNKAKQVQQYGDLLITLAQRKQPPPDLFMIKNGFVITEREAIESRTRRRIMNRMSKKVFIPPRQLSEEDYVAKCKDVINEILLGDEEALEKFYGTLVPRFNGRYGGFVKVTPLPFQWRRIYPLLAYAEFVENDLKPVPEMPIIVKGHIKAFPRGLPSSSSDILDQSVVSSS